ncbi:MAG: hypothetical protein JRD43_00495 [Deltaproteobacteria bacterium]|nr:hypothetical protein [Deltaproteobacteria bacterium]
MSKKISEFNPWKEREELYEEINQKRWSSSDNLRGKEGMPEGWTLCDVGPRHAYIELNKETIAKIDEGDIGGFWTEICSLIQPDKLESIFSNPRSYAEFLIRGSLLYCGLEGKYSVLFIKTVKPSRQLEEMLYKQGFKVSEQLGDGYESLGKVISQLESDFFKIRKSVVAYYRACFQNLLKTLLRPKEEELNEEKLNKILESTPDVSTKGISISGLTSRQHKIFEGITEGKTMKEIADNLGISDRTLRRDKEKIAKLIK